MSFLRNVVKIFLLISLVAFGYSFFQRNILPEKEWVSDKLYKEPVQRDLNMNTFQIEKGEFIYTINPKYSYELYGLIVADYNSDSWFDLTHKADPLNTEDICVIWGDNIKIGIYKDMKFSHGEFTCYWKFNKKIDPSQYSDFKQNQISNNHLLPKDNAISEKIKKAKIGDQIYFKGYLVDYNVHLLSGSNQTRNTSITRDDTGNGACEVVYVTDFQIIKKNNNTYSSIYKISGYALLVFFILFLISLFIPQRPLFK